MNQTLLVCASDSRYLKYTGCCLLEAALRRVLRRLRRQHLQHFMRKNPSPRPIKYTRVSHKMSLVGFHECDVNIC